MKRMVPGTRLHPETILPTVWPQVSLAFIVL